MIQKFVLVFPDESSIVLTRKSDSCSKNPQQTQLGGNVKFHDQMVILLESVFSEKEVETFQSAKNKLIYKFVTTEEEFMKALKIISESGVIVKEVSKIERMIR
jgi:hypothetical protein